jgi:uncharacterized metal-binding protein YceD (DUF177 family)
MTKLPPTVQYEFSRPLEVARVPKLGAHEKLQATDAECAALAKRLLVPKIHAIKAELKAQPWRGGGMKVSGQATIDLDQESVVSLELFRSTQVVALERFYLNIKGEADVDSELEIDPIENGIIDLGELVAESVALELDPYPRMPGESFTPIIESDPAEDEKAPNPFTVLQFPKGKK